METTTSVKKRCTYINDEQKNVLIEFMTKHPELQSGKFSATFTYKNAQKLWEEVTAQLHQIPGAVKEWNKWRKTWQDMRSATKAKNTSIKKHAQGTGGGPASSQVLTEIDQNILTLIGPTVVEGHNSTQESNVQFDWNDEPEVCNVEYLSHDEEIVKNSVQRDNQEVMQDSTPLKSLYSIFFVLNSFKHFAKTQ
ncbi:PREDICTED: myb-related transcription factor, partner of profilin-like isoform X1 [Trachymyrmex cornetzi]|uniref:myb-related transcription factor, partner of profilin-like isoform X1 n=2 Tax=Trachymyrmex cornetzi TaxID=471704 RepID=UPI00084F59E5|nr:PREDICTED: myb-related transcription factor, partner of profilin-like isoform X1 [Trachymyrmex cornetzi]